MWREWESLSHRTGADTDYPYAMELASHSTFHFYVVKCYSNFQNELLSAAVFHKIHPNLEAAFCNSNVLGVAVSISHFTVYSTNAPRYFKVECHTTDQHTLLHHPEIEGKGCVQVIY